MTFFRVTAKLTLFITYRNTSEHFSDMNAPLLCIRVRSILVRVLIHLSH